jgi:hypothetical protein
MAGWQNPFVNGGQVADTATNRENARGVGPMGGPSPMDPFATAALSPGAGGGMEPGALLPQMPTARPPMNPLARGAPARGLGGVAPVRSGRSSYDPTRIAERVIRQSRGRVPGGVGGARIFSDALDILGGAARGPMGGPVSTDPMRGGAISPAGRGTMDTSSGGPGLTGGPMGSSSSGGTARAGSAPAPMGGLPKVEQDKDSGVYFTIGQDDMGRPVRQLVPDAPELTDAIRGRQDAAGDAQVDVIPFFRPGEEPTYPSGLPKLPEPGAQAPTPMGMLPVLRTPGGVQPLGGGPVMTPPPVQGMTADDVAAARAMGGSVRIPLPGGAQVDLGPEAVPMVKIWNEDEKKMIDFPAGFEVPEGWRLLNRTGEAGTATGAAPAPAPALPKISYKRVQ